MLSGRRYLRLAAAGYINEGAYLAEIFRAGIMAVPIGQSEAARAIGPSRLQVMRLVILPRALHIVIPPLGNAFNGLMKTSSLASVISMDELLRRTEMLIQVRFKAVEIFMVAALCYLAIASMGRGRRAEPLARLSLPTQDAS